MADLQEMDREINSLGFRYYTLEPRPIPYKSPNTSTHPASVRAKDAADSLNEAYTQVSDMHQAIRQSLAKFKSLVGQPNYTDLSTCFAAMKTLTGSSKVTLRCKEGTDDPEALVGGSEKVEEAVKVFNEMLDTCHEFLRDYDSYLERLKQRIAALRQLAVMQQILTICSVFEEKGPMNINIYATEIRSLLLDIGSSAKQKLK